jgi:hypothetical protein
MIDTVPHRSIIRRLCGKLSQQRPVGVTSELDGPRLRLLFDKRKIETSFLAVPENRRLRSALFLPSSYPDLYHAAYKFAGYFLQT